MLGRLRFGNTDVDSNLVDIYAVQDGATDSARLVFATQATGGGTAEQMIIKSDGKIGIGTDAPGGLLELRTNANNFIGLLINQQQNQSAIHITNPQNTTAWSLKIDGTGNLTTGGLARFKNGSANTSTRSLVQIWNDNALATGTTSLEVVNDSTGLVAVFKADVPTLRLHSTHSEDAWADLEAAAALEFWNDDPSTAPASVRGHVKLLNRADGWGNKWALGFGTSSSNVTATTKMLLDYTGNLGIGTTAPSAKLHAILDSAATNTPTDVLRLGHTSTGSTAVGFGTLIRFDAERTGTTTDGMGRLGFVADTMTSSRVDGAFIVQTGLDGSYTERLRIKSGGILQLNSYGSGTHGGTSAYKLSVDSSGNVIETAIGAGAVDGSGTTNYVSKWTDEDTIGNSTIFDNGTTVGINTTTGFIGRDLAVGGVGVELGRFVNNSNGPLIDFIKSRSAVVGANAISWSGRC